MSHPVIFMSAGEVSGDMHGAHLALALLRRRPDLHLVGLGGAQMRAAGVEVLADVTAHSAVGLTEQWPHLWPVARAFREARRAIADRRPAVVVLIDFQGANMALARHARRLGISTAYYILPQEWLWGLKGGTARVARTVDRLIAVFQGEAAAYEAAGGRVSYVGHPLLDIVGSGPPAAVVTGDSSPMVALLPGSREQEVRVLLPLFLLAAAQIQSAVPGIRFVVPVASAHVAPAIDAALAVSPLAVTRLLGDERGTWCRADAVLAASGTVTLEAAIAGVPCVAAYCVSPVTAWVARRLMRTPYVTLPNIVAGRAVVPEFLQAAATPAALARAITALLRDPVVRQEHLAGLSEVRTLLGEPGAIGRAADTILADAGLAP